MKDDEISWPSAPSSREQTKFEDDERRVARTHLVQVHVNPGIDPKDFSTFRRLCRVTAWVLRFLTNCRLPRESRKRDKTLCLTEIRHMEKLWIKQAQRDAFPKGEQEGSLLRLCPKSDDDGLLRMDGRLRLADELSYDTRHPILLPKEHAVTRLIIMDAMSATFCDENTRAEDGTTAQTATSVVKSVRESWSGLWGSIFNEARTRQS